MSQFKDKKDVIQDIELLSSQVERCNQILKKLYMNPTVEDDFIDEDLNIKDYLKEILNSLMETNDKKYLFN